MEFEDEKSFNDNRFGSGLRCCICTNARKPCQGCGTGRCAHGTEDCRSRRGKSDARKAANPGADGTMVKQTPVTGEVPAGSKTAANKAEMNVEARDLRAMDTNGDGMISRKEYDAYHSAMWKQMKAKKDMVSMDEMLKRGR